MTFDEYEVAIKSEFTLQGTITKPKVDGKYAAVVIIAGSGEIDRNGTILPLKLESNIYKDLAHVLAQLGVVTLRFDKRGVGKSDGEFQKTGMWDLVSDIEAMVAYLKEQPFVDSENIILAGHSEGCMLATVVNARTPVNGLILLTGAAESLEEATKRQREIAYKELKEQKGIKGKLMRLLNVEKRGEKQMEKIKEKMMNTEKDTIKVGFKPMNAKWFREHFQHDIYKDLQQVTCPVLAIAGDKDFQANPEKAKRIGDYVQGDSEIYVVKNMDHTLKYFEGDFKALEFKKIYTEGADKPLHPELEGIIVNWMDARFISQYAGSKTL
ncbi:alpha/beta hydrolase family protein [Bacillus wiedmannii]|uniref:Alpha/beta hydrolase n=1 Tax=Bacillus wiedmannii TaxID=1890302 RepID=A0A2C3UDW3_9BACI|nr:alpha/beta hydrolase [Bacillus wiedmannii]MCU5098053.1 lysophospholipase [Bacillus wiedmannii]PDZ43234.1 alpha/beta hydrolase [Bacillus wiedmannii]PEO08867.1 alpha/beta hydrolase [Bacillus wiedmannii]PEP11192.1 alpha/beta hydrolase [Bacillus wiedmannii]PHB05677.1 alpha/beta hydrolase [Bacillus wiedmannii]